MIVSTLVSDQPLGSPENDKRQRMVNSDQGVDETDADAGHQQDVETWVHMLVEPLMRRLAVPLGTAQPSNQSTTNRGFGVTFSIPVVRNREAVARRNVARHGDTARLETCATSGREPTLSSCQCLLELTDVQRVKDVAGLEPAPARHQHAVLHILEMADVMGVG